MDPPRRRASTPYNLRSQPPKVKRATLLVNPANKKISKGTHRMIIPRQTKVDGPELGLTVNPIPHLLEPGPPTHQPLTGSGRLNAIATNLDTPPTILQAILKDAPPIVPVPLSPDIGNFAADPFNQAVQLADIPSPPPSTPTHVGNELETMAVPHGNLTQTISTPVSVAIAESAPLSSLLSHSAQNRDYPTYSRLLQDITSMAGTSDPEIVDAACCTLVALPANTCTLDWLYSMLSRHRPTLDLPTLATILGGTDLITKFVMNSASGDVTELQGLQDVMQEGHEIVYSYCAQADLTSGSSERMQLLNFISDQMRKLVHVPF